MALIDRKLLECNLKHNTNYTYIVGDCLFDSIAYLLQYAISSTALRFNSMHHLSHCLKINKPKARQTCDQELNAEWLFDLHKGISNEYQYMQKMALSAVHGGLWGDFIAIKWIFDYLQRPIYIWHINSARVISMFGSEFDIEPLHLAFRSSHFELIEKVNQNMPIILPRQNRDTKIINLESNNLYKKSSINSQKTWMSHMLL